MVFPAENLQILENKQVLRSFFFSSEKTFARLPFFKLKAKSCIFHLAEVQHVLKVEAMQSGVNSSDTGTLDNCETICAYSIFHCEILYTAFRVGWDSQRRFLTRISTA